MRQPRDMGGVDVETFLSPPDAFSSLVPYIPARAFTRFALKRALDDDFLNIAGAFVDLAHAHVTVNALERKVFDVTVATQRLDGGAADELGCLAGKELGHGGFFQAGPTGVAQGGCVPGELACGFELCGAVGQAKTHRLVAEQGLTKAFALLGVVDGELERAARHADALRGNADAPALER